MIHKIIIVNNKRLYNNLIKTINNKLQKTHKYINNQSEKHHYKYNQSNNKNNNKTMRK